MSIPREIESAIYDLMANANDPYSCVEGGSEREAAKDALDALVKRIERAIAEAVDAERERCAALADACHMERVLQHPEALKAGGDAAAVAAKGSEAARIAAAIRRSTRKSNHSETPNSCAELISALDKHRAALDAWRAALLASTPAPANWPDQIDAAVRPWRELVDRAVPMIELWKQSCDERDYVIGNDDGFNAASSWLRAKAALEKQR